MFLCIFSTEVLSTTDLEPILVFYVTHVLRVGPVVPVKRVDTDRSTALSIVRANMVPTDSSSPNLDVVFQFKEVEALGSTPVTKYTRRGQVDVTSPLFSTQ